MTRLSLCATLVAVSLCSSPSWAEDEKEHHHHHHHHHSRKKSDEAEASPEPDAAASTAAPSTSTSPSPSTAPSTSASTTTPPSSGSPAARKASAQVDLDNGKDRPWAKGVSAAELQAADVLFHEGNALLKESLFVQAAEKYREALRHWDHPAIHYNLSLALLNLDQPVEVFNHLESAMRFGPAPLELDKFEHAGRYRALIEKQIARVEVTCNKAGGVVAMDGTTIFTAPGRYEAYVRAGQHTFVATKPGYVTAQKTPLLLPGQKTTIDLQLFTNDELIQYKRRWSNALPWSVVAAGVVVAGLGGVMHWQAATKYSSYDDGITSCAAATGSLGCMPDGSLSGRKSTGDGLQIGAFVAYGVGGATLATGLVLAVLNRAKPVRLEHENKVSLSASIAPGQGGASATVRF